MSISPFGSDVSEVSYMSRCRRFFTNTLNINSSERDFPDSPGSPTIQSVKKARLM
ncbi:hypothetical protein [Candidatus Mesenet endosymbiont of Agriotes lineatus]|uniref:hypothetical protein n=1 Tax=Candidatus Mesenet endosymbiont of Agriotes lineatus TaxID=3077948 RepID=UPI0030CE1CF8